MNENEIRNTVNWLYTVIGSFTFYIGFLVAYKCSRPELDIIFPVVGKLSYSATLIFGIPVLTIAVLSILYFCFHFFTEVVSRPTSYCHYFPAPFNLDLNVAFAKLRCLFFFLFTMFPTLVSVFLFSRLFGKQQLYDSDSGAHISRWQLFIFETRWWDGELWRWTSEQSGERLSGYPGFQPILYVLLIASCLILIIVLMLKIVIKHRSPTQQSGSSP